MDGRDVFVADRYLHQHHVQALSLDQHPQVQTLHYRRYISKNRRSTSSTGELAFRKSAATAPLGGSGLLGASPCSREELDPGTWLWRAEQTGWMPHLTLCYPSLWKLQIQLPENETEAQTSRFQSDGVKQWAKQKSNRRIKGLNVPPGPP